MRHSAKSRAHTPGGSKVCRIRKHRLDFRKRSAQLFRNGRKIAAQIPRFIDKIDQMLADDALHGLRDREHQLTGEMIGEGDFSRNEGL